MNQEQGKESQNKENTMDILVTPKKKEEPVAPTPVQQKEKSAPAPQKGKASSVKRPMDPSVQKSKTRIGSAILPASAVEIKKPPKKEAEAPKTKQKKKPKERHAPLGAEEKRAMRASMRSTAMLALIYIAIVVSISALLSYFGIRFGNDVFALVKDDVTATVTIPEDATVSEVAKLLYQNHLIEYPSVFRFYVGLRYRKSDPPLAFKAGEYEINSTLNYDQMVSLIKARKTRSIIKLTIPEGYTVDQIIDLFLSEGIGTREGFVDAINNYPYEYTFMEKLNAVTLSPDRVYRLEGYLFPDTYEFYTDSKEVAIIDRMLQAFDLHMEKGMYDRMDELGMNIDQIITLASIVQREGKIKQDLYSIAGVFHNRLASSDLKLLQSDATVQYCLPEHKEDLTQGDLEVNNPYNTYLYPGLPPSAIANPGMEAIQAALYPEKHKYYYFVSDTDGSTLFAATHAEHLKNVAAVAAAKENNTSVD